MLETDPVSGDAEIRHQLELLRRVRRDHQVSDEVKMFWLRWAANADNSRRKALMYQCLAEFAAYAGDAEGCLGWLELAVDVGLTDLLWLDRCPLFAQVRQRPRFVQARDKLKVAVGVD